MNLIVSLRTPGTIYSYEPHTRNKINIQTTVFIIPDALTKHTLVILEELRH
jgi:hypothetical protein